MYKSYEQFRYSDWEWIAVHFPPAEREDMARVAWLITQCSADEIAKHKNLDPRIIIPLCAIEFQDEINWEKLKILRKEEIENININNPFVNTISDSEIVPYFLVTKYRKRIELLSHISDSERWITLLSSLELNLQVKLLYLLHDSYRCPRRNDWRDIFQKIIYDFTKSWHYRFILLCTIAFIVFSLLAINSITLKENNIFWINISKGLALYILITFWFSSLNSSIYFIKYCLLGLFKFQQNILYFLGIKKNNLNINISPRIEIIIGPLVLIWALFSNGQWIQAMPIILFYSLAFFGKFQWTWFMKIVLFMFITRLIIYLYIINLWIFIAGIILLLLLTIAVEFLNYEMNSRNLLPFFINLFTYLILILLGGITIIAEQLLGVISKVEDGFIFGILIGFLLTTVELFCYMNNRNYLRFLYILTFPLFCWFPILVSFATLFLLRYFSWQNTLLIWLISLGTCTGLWLYGQDKERKATNPLKGILSDS